MFVFLSLLALLQMGLFRSIGGDYDLVKYNWVGKLSFGSLSFGTPLCSKAVIDWKGSESTKFIYRCPYGTHVSDVFSSGIVSYTDIEDYRGLVEVYAECYYDSENPMDDSV